MESNVVKKILNNLKEKIKIKPKLNSSLNDYAFNTKELDELNKDNYKKIKELKKDIANDNKKEEVLNEEELNDSILIKEEKQEEENNNDTDDKTLLNQISEELQVDALTNTQKIEKKHKISYLNLDEKETNLIMTKWHEIDTNSIDKDIIDAKDLLNHNYTITYADDAEKFIHNIRKKYEVVICYLIGFNNEKKGIYEKTYFSNTKDSEWKYLNYYIKLLEKIRNFKQQ